MTKSYLVVHKNREPKTQNRQERMNTVSQNECADNVSASGKEEHPGGWLRQRYGDFKSVATAETLPTPPRARNSACSTRADSASYNRLEKIRQFLYQEGS